MATFAWQMTGRLLVIVHGRSSPGPGEWSAFVRAMEQVPRPSRLRSLVYSAGGAPNGRQRVELESAFRGEEVQVAILASGLLARSAAFLGSLLNRRIRSFSPQRRDVAMAYLGLSDVEAAEASRLVAALATELHVELRAPGLSLS